MKNNTKAIILLVVGALLSVGSCVYGLLRYHNAFDLVPKGAQELIFFIILGVGLMGMSFGVAIFCPKEEKC